MFSTLLESKRARQKNFLSNAVSGVFHALLVVGAVYTTAKGNEPPPDDTLEDAVFTEVRPKDPPPVEPVRNVEAPKVTAEKVHGFESLTAPIVIPTVIPDVNYSDKITNPDDYTPNGGVRGGDPNSLIRGTAVDTATKFIFEVEKAARMLAGNPEPDYPAIMKQTRQTGNVRIAFVIDTTGRADMSTLRVLESSNNLFTESVKKILPKYRFLPAEIGGRKVRMHVELPFLFALDPKGGE